MRHKGAGIEVTRIAVTIVIVNSRIGVGNRLVRSAIPQLIASAVEHTCDRGGIAAVYPSNVEVTVVVVVVGGIVSELGM